MIKTSLRLLPAALLLAFSGLASAAAYQALEHNAGGLGVAYAGTAAVADNAATLYANPAGMTRLQGINFSMGVAGVAERYKFRQAGGGASGGNAGESNTLANVFMSWQFAPGLSAGLGISRPWLLDTQYSTGWVGQAEGLRSELTTVNVNPAIAYEVNDLLALGVGLNYQKMDVRVTDVANFKGDDSALGWNAGALFTLSPAMRVGIAYRSKIEHDLSGRFNGTPARRDVDTPASFTLSVWQQVSDRWEAMGDLSLTRWKSVDGFDLDNAWRLSWGAAYKYSDQAKLKFGVAYDRSPVSDSKRTVRMPDSDRLLLSLGGQWNLGRSSVVDLGYGYRYMRGAKVRDGAAVGKYDSAAHVFGVQYSVGF